jgi:hypothetical protein
MHPIPRGLMSRVVTPWLLAAIEDQIVRYGVRCFCRTRTDLDRADRKRLRTVLS